MVYAHLHGGMFYFQKWRRNTMKIIYESPKGIIIENPNIDELKCAMINNFPEYWHQGNGSATIDFHDEEKGHLSLLVLPNDEYGIYLKYLKLVNGRVQGEWLSIEDDQRLSETVESSDEWYASIGLFLPKEKAWLAIENFLKTGEMSEEIKWISSEDMPEDSNW